MPSTINLKELQSKPTRRYRFTLIVRGCNPKDREIKSKDGWEYREGEVLVYT